MRGPHNVLRLIRTGATFERTGAMYVVLEGFGAPTSLRILVRALGWPFKWLGLKGDPTLPPVTRALTALGPSYIKFGQILSTRPDIVGNEMSLQLKYLQDQLPPFPTHLAKAMVAAELGQPVEAMFDDFSEPVAAASIAQVHKARLREDGRLVAVKVLRPGIERAFRKDIDAFYLAARTIEAFLPSTRRLRPTDVITHFEGVVMGELDLRLEAASASEFTVNTAGDTGFQVPQPLWRLSGRSVMTMDWAEGINLSDNAALDAAGHDRVVLGARVLQLFLSHALRDGFFHADMHQGNLKVAENGDIIAYDFGIMGRIDAYTRKVYAEILMGFIQRNYRRVAEVHFEAGYVPADRDVEAFASALRAVGEPIFGMEANRISMAKLLAYLFEVTERFGMETRTELILLQRTMVVVEGVARSLDENINIWQVANPVVESYVRSHVGPVALAKDLVSTLQVLARFGPKLPRLVENFLIAQADGPKPPAPRRGVPIGWAMVGAVALLAAGVWAGIWMR
ncbi:MAG: 2-polyprenylphenol 6-hydroxylase [Cypionkella sp.]